MKKTILTGLFILLVSWAAFTPAMAVESAIILGTVKDHFQLVEDNGDTYEIGQNDLGEELARYIHKKVKVTGTLIRSEEKNIIVVVTYEVIGD